MNSQQLRALADAIDNLEQAGLEVAIVLPAEGMVLNIDDAEVAAIPKDEPFADGTRFTDRTGWVDAPPEATGG